MGRSFALLLAAAIVAGASAGAQAADLLPPPPPMEPPPPVDFGGWYLRGDVGVGFNQISGWRSTLQPAVLGGAVVLPSGPIWQLGHSLDTTAFVGGGIGYQFNGWFRGDVTAEYRFAAGYKAGQGYFCPVCFHPVGTDEYNGNVGTALFMANGYFDLGTWYGFTPYVGGGVGAAMHNVSAITDYNPVTGGAGFGTTANVTNFAWAAMAGVSYAVTPNLRLDLGYRYVDMGNVTTGPISCLGAPCFRERHSFNIASNDIRFGFRYLLGGFAPPPVLAPPPPLIRKY
jgi:opacity protein-like surface antigen